MRTAWSPNACQPFQVSLRHQDKVVSDRLLSWSHAPAWECVASCAVYRRIVEFMPPCGACHFGIGGSGNSQSQMVAEPIRPIPNQKPDKTCATVLAPLAPFF
jgi:hypothetical protein